MPTKRGRFTADRRLSNAAPQVVPSHQQCAFQADRDGARIAVRTPGACQARTHHALQANNGRSLGATVRN